MHIQLLVVVFAMMAVMTYRVSIAAVMYNVSFYPKSYVKLFVTCTAATLNLMVIVILNKVLHKRRSVMEIHYVQLPSLHLILFACLFASIST